MHFSFLEKLGLGCLVAAWVTWGSAQIGSALVKSEPLAQAGYEVAVTTDDGAAAAPKEEEAPVDVLAILASMDVAQGAKVFKKCAGCHTGEEGAKHKVGPNLWDIVNREKGKVAGYKFSGALANIGGAWTYENLNGFLENPKEYAPGNKMTYRGLKKPEDRAAVIAYMRTLSANPAPLP